MKHVECDAAAEKRYWEMEEALRQQVALRIAAEKRAEEAERFIGNHTPQCRHYSWPHGPRCFDALEQRLAEWPTFSDGERVSQLTLNALIATHCTSEHCDIERERDEALKRAEEAERMRDLYKESRAMLVERAHASVERIKDDLRAQAHEDLDECLDEAERAEYGWVHDDGERYETDRIYRHVHALAVRAASTAAKKDA